MMGKLHDALTASGYEGHNLERFLVRLVFCLFADDTGIFEPRDIFSTLIAERTNQDGSDTGLWISQLFEVLNTPLNERQKTSMRTWRSSLTSMEISLKNACRFRLSTPACAAADRRVRLQLGRHLAGDIRVALPVRYEPQGAPVARGALHHREEHPKGHRAAFSGRSSRRV